MSAQLDGAAEAFNVALSDALEPFQGSQRGQFLVLADIEGLFNLIIAKPRWFRLKNVTDSCTVFDPAGTGLGTALKDGVNPRRYLFWDSVHPTKRGHDIISNAVFLKLHFPFSFRPGASVLEAYCP